MAGLPDGIGTDKVLMGENNAGRNNRYRYILFDLLREFTTLSMFTIPLIVGLTQMIA